MTLSDEALRRWEAITYELARDPLNALLYARAHDAARDRAALWRALVRRSGVSQTHIARAFGVSQQAVSKAIKGKRI
jgi:hypothetical protein